MNTWVFSKNINSSSAALLRFTIGRPNVDVTYQQVTLIFEGIFNYKSSGQHLISVHSEMYTQAAAGKKET